MSANGGPASEGSASRHLADHGEDPTNEQQPAPLGVWGSDTRESTVVGLRGLEPLTCSLSALATYEVPGRDPVIGE